MQFACHLFYLETFATNFHSLFAFRYRIDSNFFIFFFFVSTVERSQIGLIVLLSEVRQEAVQQALAAMQNRPKPSLPMPSKRTSVMAKSPDRERHDSGKRFAVSSFFFVSSYFFILFLLQWLNKNKIRHWIIFFLDSSSGDYSGGEGGDIQSTPERERARTTQMVPQSDTSSTGSARETPPQQRQIHRNARWVFDLIARRLSKEKSNGNPNRCHRFRQTNLVCRESKTRKRFANDFFHFRFFPRFYFWPQIFILNLNPGNEFGLKFKNNYFLVLVLLSSNFIISFSRNGLVFLLRA